MFMRNNYVKSNQYYFHLFPGKGELWVQVWDDDTAQDNDDDFIDLFKVIMPTTSIDSGQSKMDTVQGTNKIVNFTLIYYNLTTDGTSSSSTDNSTSCLCTRGQQGRIRMSK